MVDRGFLTAIEDRSPMNSIADARQSAMVGNESK